MTKTQHFIRVIFSKAAYAVLPVLFFAALPLCAQTADVRYAGVYYVNGYSAATAESLKNVYCDYTVGASSQTAAFISQVISGSTATAYNRSFVYDTDTNPAGNSIKKDPWVNSALIEYDQPYTAPDSTNNYPNHCLSLCMNVVCTNKPIGGSTYSIAFPLQQIRFDIVKYYNGKNVENPEETPAIRTIDLYPDMEQAKCGSYRCPGSADSGYTCNSARYYARDDLGTGCRSLEDDSLQPAATCGCPSTGVCNFVIFNNDGTMTNKAIPFCAAWDGSYEIAGEFGKTNGDYAFRASVVTDVPGDNIITDKISFSSTIAYPGENQIPIQVDVTNVHTVRSTPTVVGNITAVSTEPYTYSYKLSKDADVRIAIFDAENLDSKDYGETASAVNIAEKNLVRTLVDWQPRLGEGLNGKQGDVQITEFDSWDGRNDAGVLLPAGNYIATIQAKTQDEWPGVDFSRAVTRQLSLDPLKITDVRTASLNKQSTAYASISYVLTEDANVYWEIYTPGTSFSTTTVNSLGGLLTNSAKPVGTGPTPINGSLVYRLEEGRAGRVNWTNKWDGLCGNAAGCTRTYTNQETMSDGVKCGTDSGAHKATNGLCAETYEYGAPLPDGNYVYALWAEIPYNGRYLNILASSSGPKLDTSSTTCSGTGVYIDGQCFTAVKTLNYKTGDIAIDRGKVDVTIQPVSYDTVGSSPTAYGLNPFIFKYSISRPATVIASVQNTAGVVVKYLTSQTGDSQVAQQLNTLSWNGMDDAGRMVTPGTYLFVVETKDAMFPAVTNRAAAVFPVDMYRIVDVATTDVYGDSEAKATISYLLSKSMNVQVNIYNKDVVIPDYNKLTSPYNDNTVTASYDGVGYTNTLNTNTTVRLSNGTDVVVQAANVALGTSTVIGGGTSGNPYYRDTITVINNPSYDAQLAPAEPRYRVTLLREYLALTTDGTATWPPRICDRSTDADVFKNTSGGTCASGNTCYVDPGAITDAHACIYVNDTSFTNYPSTRTVVAAGVYDVRLQPIKTFERSSTKPGDGITIMEEWDALYFYNPKNCAAGSTNIKNCKYEMLPDGQYPFFISARSDEAFDRYYFDKNVDTTGSYPTIYTVDKTPFKYSTETVHANYLYATEKPVGKINVTRGSVYFLDGSTVVYPNAPQLFNVSSGPVFVPPYEINFSVSRAATVEVAIVALQDNVCNPDPTVRQDVKNNRAGDVCKFLSTMTIANTGHFDANIVRKTYWDGTDNNGYYVKPGIYEVRLTAKNYPNPSLYQPTVKSITLNADLLKVFDLLEADGYAISQRGTDMHISYQISVPMKVAIQIFKPGTTIYDYEKGTLRNPTTGTEVTNIRDVLVKSIVGIRPATTLIDEVWDGTDYAGQEVPDGTYPFRFVTALNSADIDSVTGEIIHAGVDDTSTTPADWKVNYVADKYEYQNLHKATIAIGDGRFVCDDWEKTVFFYPNPLKSSDKGTLEITKMPVPGEVSIKYYTLAGQLVREGNYTCVDANNYQTTMGSSLSFNPDNDPEGATKMTQADLAIFPSQRNAALRCRWDSTNQHGKKVARGVYFGLVDFKALNGREHCQKVVKILIP